MPRIRSRRTQTAQKSKDAEDSKRTHLSSLEFWEEPAKWKLTKREAVLYFLVPFLISITVGLMFMFLFFAKTDKGSINITRLFSFSIPVVSNPFAVSLNTSPQEKVFDPYVLVLRFEDTDYLLVDLRSEGEFSREHIRGAVSVPLYGEFTDLKDLKIKNDFVSKVKELRRDKKTVILYGNTRDSAYVRDAVSLLQNKNVDAYKLGAGWNEWRHFRNLWVPEAQWDTFDPDRYLEGQAREE